MISKDTGELDNIIFAGALSSAYEINEEKTEESPADPSQNSQHEKSFLAQQLFNQIHDLQNKEEEMQEEYPDVDEEYGGEEFEEVKENIHEDPIDDEVKEEI